MKKLVLVIMVLMLSGCTQSKDLSKWKDVAHGDQYTIIVRDGEVEYPSRLKIFLDEETSDIITSINVNTGYTVDLIQMIHPEFDDEASLKESSRLCEVQMDHRDHDQKKVEGYDDYLQLKKSGTKDYPLFSAYYIDRCPMAFSIEDRAYSLEVLNFAFWNKDVDLSDPTMKKILKRYHLDEAYDEKTGFLSYKKLKESKNFEYKFYFDFGEKEVIDKSQN